MAKTGVEITSWEDANKALRRMGELAILRIVAASKYKEGVDRLQAALDAVKAPWDKEYEKLEDQVKSFATAHKSELVGKSRTKKLSFGAVSFKLSSGTVIFKLAPELIIMNLKQLGHADCVRPLGEEVDKEAVKNIDVNDLAKAGIEINKPDICSVKPDLKKIQEEVGK